MTAKEEAREQARAARRAGPPADGFALAAQALAFLKDLGGPRRITAYASFGTEPSTDELLADASAAGYTVLLPRISGITLEWATADDGMLVSGRIREPVGPAQDLLPVRALLVPALAVSPDGARLGKGGGFYDRVIASLPTGADRPCIAALVRDEDIWPAGAIPTEDFDRHVDVVITPTRVLVCAADD